MNNAGERLYNGIIKENPTFVLMLGMCPTLAVTTSAINGLGMGLTTAAVLALSNTFISLLRKVIPNKVRIPAFIVIIASFVTVMQLLLQAYIPSLYSALGIYIPLIVVNCIILGRAEAYASSNKVIPSFFDGLGMGLGFSIALTCIGAVRELLGNGTIFGVNTLFEGTNYSFRFIPSAFEPIGIFILAPGAFFVLATLTAIQNYAKAKAKAKNKEGADKIQSGCNSDCMNCTDSGCSVRFIDLSEEQNGTNKETQVKTSEDASASNEDFADAKINITKKETKKKTQEEIRKETRKEKKKETEEETKKRSKNESKKESKKELDEVKVDVVEEMVREQKFEDLNQDDEIEILDFDETDKEDN